MPDLWPVTESLTVFFAQISSSLSAALTSMNRSSSTLNRMVCSYSQDNKAYSGNCS